MCSLVDESVAGSEAILTGACDARVEHAHGEMSVIADGGVVVVVVRGRQEVSTTPPSARARADGVCAPVPFAFPLREPNSANLMASRMCVRVDLVRRWPGPHNRRIWGCGSCRSKNIGIFACPHGQVKYSQACSRDVAGVANGVCVCRCGCVSLWGRARTSVCVCAYITVGMLANAFLQR